jgi:predicted restriction endonuclease
MKLKLAILEKLDAKVALSPDRKVLCATIDTLIGRNNEKIDETSLSRLRELYGEAESEFRLEIRINRNGIKKCRRQIIKICGNKCYICGNGFWQILQVHHLLPVNEGGDSGLENLIVLCPNCHATVHRILECRNNCSKSTQKLQTHKNHENQRTLLNEMLEEHFVRSQIMKLITIGMRKQKP